MPDFIQTYLRNSELIRQPLKELKKAAEDATDEEVVDAMAFFDRNGDIQAVKDLMTKRFATGIKKDKDNPNAANTSAYYTRNVPQKAIEMGHNPVVSTGLGTQIAKALATLTTQPSQRYEYLIPGQVDEQGITARSEETAEIIKAVRLKGGYDEAIEAADFISVCVESSAFHCYWGGRTLKYDAILPSDIKFVYGSVIVDDGVERGIDYTDIEDASAVIIRTASNKGSVDGTPDKQAWLAYVGACPEYPDGRMVSYTAQDYWPIPAEGADGAIDYRHDQGGPICNPLTYLQNHGGKLAPLSKHEYPISILRGGIRVKVSELMPISTSLYESSLEVELAWSQILKYALMSARGKDVFTQSGVKSWGGRLPDNLDIIVLPEGLEYRQDGRSASESTGATEVVKVIAQQTAGGFSVPGYMVVKGSGAPEAGIALAIQTRPLMDNRERRRSINLTAFERIFFTEVGLITEYTGEAPIGPDIVQRWSPGKWIPPRDEKAELEVIASAMDIKVMDLVEAVIRFYPEITTAAEAQVVIDKFTERDPGYTDAAPTPATPPGLFGATQ